MEPTVNHSAFYAAQMGSTSTNSSTNFYNPIPDDYLGYNIPSQLIQQIQEVDRLILYHVEKVRAKLLENQQWFWHQALVVVNDDLSKQLMAKDQEIEQLMRLTWALEEKIKGLILESQFWQELTHTKEAEVMMLRNNLKQMVATHLHADEGTDSNYFGDNLLERGCVSSDCASRLCRMCGKVEASVLLLPCRHMCLCNVCVPNVNACPICKSGKHATVNVEMV